MSAAGAPRSRAGEISTEDRRQRRCVGEVEIAQACDRYIEMDRVDALAKGSGLYALFEDFRNHADERGGHVLEPERSADVPRAIAVFVIEQHDKIRMPRQMIERTLDQLLDGPFGRQPREVEL